MGWKTGEVSLLDGVVGGWMVVEVGGLVFVVGHPFLRLVLGGSVLGLRSCCLEVLLRVVGSFAAKAFSKVSFFWG